MNNGPACSAPVRISRSRDRIQESVAVRLLRLLDDLPRVISAVLLTVLVVQLAAATMTAVLAQRWFGGLGVTIATVVLTLVLFVYGEVIPKTWALRSPLPVALGLATPLSALAFVLRPLVSLLVAFAEWQSPGRGAEAGTAIGEAELRKLAAEAALEGEIEHSDAELIERSFELGDLTVDDVLIPRTEVIAVMSRTRATAALDVALRSGHRRLPVHDGSLDKITGIVRLRDLAASVQRSTDPPVAELAVDALIVPDTMPVIDLIGRMRESSTPFAVAIDEYGGTAGIVTVEDVVAELIGRVEADRAAHSGIRPLDYQRWLVSGATRIHDLEAVLDVVFETGEVQTVGGLVIDIAGHIPRVGETVTTLGIAFEVTQCTRQRVLEVEVRHEPPS